jgi:hypothetical protein
MTKYERLLARRAVPGRLVSFSARYNSLQEGEDIKYLLESMDPMDADHTKVSLTEAERIYKYLEPFCTIRLQGSVTTNTHIRYHSDIDVLTITEAFKIYELPLPLGISTYSGDAVTTLKALRALSRKTIGDAFPKVLLKDKNRAVELSGGSLQRKIDLVTANWYETKASQISHADRDRGVYILDASTNSTVLNKPFLHQALINEKNANTGDGLARGIRFLKTLKVDADSKIEISSYDICSLVWNMDSDKLSGRVEHSFQLAQYVENTLWVWTQNPAYLASLNVPNLTRKIIGSEGTTAAAIGALWLEAYRLLKRISESGKDLQKRVLVHNNALLQY